MSHHSNKEPLDRFWTCSECGHSNHKSRARCHYCSIRKEQLTVFKEINPFVRNFVIQALEPVIECLQSLIDVDLRRYVLTSTKRELKPVVGHLQSLVDALTPMPKFPKEVKR